MASDNTFVHADQSLLDCLDRFERAPEGCRAAYVALSLLRPHNKERIRLRLAAHLFESLVTGYGCDVFILSNDDLVVIGRGVPATALEKHVERVRALFRRDPATRENANGEDRFFTPYEIDTGARALRQRVEDLRKGKIDPWRIISRTQPPPKPDKVAPRPLLHASDVLDGLDPRPLIRRQPVVRIDAERRGRVIGEEFYVAMHEVRKHCAQNMDLQSNRWLFQEICRLLDPKTLTAIAHLDALPDAGIHLGLNLTLETILSPALDQLLAKLPGETRLVVEVRVIDVFTSLSLLPKAAERLRALGHTFVLDQVDPRALAMIDPARLAVDRLKLVWSDDLADPASVWDGPRPERWIQTVGPDTIILSHIQNDKGILWGLKNGISVFQGFFIDQIIGATTMTGCPRAAECTLMQCVQRRRSAAGPIRESCPSLENLTAVKDLRALGRAAGAGTPSQTKRDRDA